VLRRIELEVLATVERGDTISELATKLDHSKSYLSRAVGDLGEKGLIYTERDGRQKQVIPSDARAVELYQDLVRQHSHIDFPELLTGKTLEVLYYFDQPLTISEIADWSDNCRNTVNRILKRFRDRGLVGADDSR
jgi:DNA-binding MarR family transcriptional regulator